MIVGRMLIWYQIWCCYWMVYIIMVPKHITKQDEDLKNRMMLYHRVIWDVLEEWIERVMNNTCYCVVVLPYYKRYKHKYIQYHYRVLYSHWFIIYPYLYLIGMLSIHLWSYHLCGSRIYHSEHKHFDNVVSPTRLPLRCVIIPPRYSKYTIFRIFRANRYDN